MAVHQYNIYPRIKKNVFNVTITFLAMRSAYGYITCGEVQANLTDAQHHFSLSFCVISGTSSRCFQPDIKFFMFNVIRRAPLVARTLYYSICRESRWQRGLCFRITFEYTQFVRFVYGQLVESISYSKHAWICYTKEDSQTKVTHTHTHPNTFIIYYWVGVYWVGAVIRLMCGCVTLLHDDNLVHFDNCSSGRCVALCSPFTPCIWREPHCRLWQPFPSNYKRQLQSRAVDLHTMCWYNPNNHEFFARSLTAHMCLWF